MILLWYKTHSHRPNRTDTIRNDAQAASTLPSSSEVVGVTHGRQTGERDDGTPIVDQTQFALRVEPPSDSMSQNAIDAIATAFEDRWGGSVEFVESVVR
jgi:hypothetical protein